MSKSKGKKTTTQKSVQDIVSIDLLQKKYFFDIEVKDNEDLAEEFFTYCNSIALQEASKPTKTIGLEDTKFKLIRKELFKNWLKEKIKTFPEDMPKTFSRIVLWIKEQNIESDGRYVAILEELDKINRANYFAEVEKAKKLAIANFYKFIESPKTQVSIDVVNRELTKLEKFGSFSKLDKKEDISKLTLFLDEHIIPLYSSNTIPMIQKSELLYKLILLFISDYDRDTTKHTPIQTEVISCIIRMVNAILEQKVEGELVQISDPTFIRCLVYLTDYCNLLGNKQIRPEYIIPSRFKFNAENGANFALDKLDAAKTYLKLDDTYHGVKEYLLFLDPKLGYVEQDLTASHVGGYEGTMLSTVDTPTSNTTPTSSPRKIHSVAAIVGFKMRVDYFIKKRNELFGFLAEVDGPTHFQFTIIDRAMVNPHTVIRDRIREAMLIKEDTSKQAVTAKSELSKELANRVELLEEREQALKAINDILSITNYKGMHINPVKQTLIVSADRAQNIGFIQKKIKEIEERTAKKHTKEASIEYFI